MEANFDNNRLDDRRIGPDTLVKLSASIAGFSKLLVFVSVVFSWILFSTAFIIEYVIKTPFNGFIQNQSGLIEKEHWFSLLVNFSLYLIVTVFILCLLGLFVNYFRHHRKDDTYNKSLVVFTIFSFISFLFICIMSLFSLSS
ncbi:MAG: hypothetical protein JW864_11865 [Spirochaetes bacterium]|nr:hypothetical protein [Spirochaetota bacterium]